MALKSCTVVQFQMLIVNRMYSNFTFTQRGLLMPCRHACTSDSFDILQPLYSPVDYNASSAVYSAFKIKASFAEVALNTVVPCSRICLMYVHYFVKQKNCRIAAEAIPPSRSYRLQLLLYIVSMFCCCKSLFCVSDIAVCLLHRRRC